MSPLPLAGLRVAITRPAAQADTLSHLMSSAGAQVTRIPMVAIEPLQSPEARARIRRDLTDLPGYQHVIFISRNAAEQALVALREADLPWPQTTQAYGIGLSTAQWLDTQGIASMWPERMNSEGLLTLQPLQNGNNQRILIFRGVGGRETLAQGLRARGFAVDYCELYRRSLPPAAKSGWTAWRAQCEKDATDTAVVCLNSVETLDNLLSIDEHCPSNHDLVCLVPGERVARAAHERGFTRLIITPDALDATQVKTLHDWRLCQTTPRPER
jgi:uroporphyrinogen-III synthase